MESVGIRALKAQLSSHLKRVQAGARLAVTERGRVIATISPAVGEAQPEVEWASTLVGAGAATWAGGKPSGARPRVRRASKATVSDAVLQDRR
jgi:antitoxin (DNA-binding transcriptional repressor) of toxin-antitoxin stability system